MPNSKVQRLAEFMIGLFGGVDELLRQVKYAEMGDLHHSISKHLDLRSAADEAADAILRQGWVEAFLEHLLDQSEYLRRRDDIVELASLLGVGSGSATRRYYLTEIIEIAERRSILRGLRGSEVTLASVYLDRVVSALDEPDFCGSPLMDRLRTLAPGQALLVLGEPGAGKTELLLHTAAALARTALADVTAPLPLWMSAADFVAGKGLVGALCARWCDGTDAARALIASATGVILLIDSLDEAQDNRLVPTLEQERRRLGDRLRALVLSSRPAFTPGLANCVRVQLLPLTPRDSIDLLVRWEVIDPEAVAAVRARSHEPEIAEFMRSPLLATLCLLAVRRRGDALDSRSRLFATIYDDILQWWPRNRSPDAPSDACWPSVSGMLRDIALDWLRYKRTEISRTELESRLRRFDADDWMIRLQAIERRLGILVPSYSDDSYRFIDRRIVEYLVARRLCEDVTTLAQVASEPWAAEPLRITVGLLADEQPAMASRAIRDLLADEGHDLPGVRDAALRAVLVAIEVAADEPRLGAQIAGPLAEAVARRVLEENSNWVGDWVARAARRLARVSGPVWSHLEPRISAVVMDETLSREMHKDALLPLLTTVEAAVDALLHRSPEMRLAACERLAEFCDVADVQNCLLYVLFDDGESRTGHLPATAGWALRHATRGPAFTPVLRALQNFVTWGAQGPSCGAAIALLPGEADADVVVAALELGLHTHVNIPASVFEDLLATQAGADALGRLFPDWRERREQRSMRWGGSPTPLLHVPASGVCRSRAFEVLTGGRVAPAILDRALSISENFHYYTDSLDLLARDDLDVLLSRVRAVNYELCAVAQHKLGVLASTEPELARWVLEWWDGLDHADPHKYYIFPGRALEPLVLAGDRRAIAAFAAWLPHSHHVHSGMLTLHNAKISRTVLAVPAIRAAAFGTFTGGDGNSVSLPALTQLTAAWDRDEALWARVEGWIRSEHDKWLEDPQGSWLWRQWFIELRGVEIPAVVRALILATFRDVVRSPRHGQTMVDAMAWHMFVAHFIEFAVDHDLMAECKAELEFLAGVGCVPPCRLIGVHAASVLSEGLAPDERRRVSALWAANFNGAREISHINSRGLRLLIEASPEDWTIALLDLLSKSRLNVSYPEHELLVFECLPFAAQLEVIPTLLASAGRSEIPWIRQKLSRRRVRFSDEVRRVAFEAGII